MNSLLPSQPSTSPCRAPPPSPRCAPFSSPRRPTSLPTFSGAEHPHPTHLLRLRRPPLPPAASHGHHHLRRPPPSSFSHTIQRAWRDPTALGPRRGLSHRIRPPSAPQRGIPPARAAHRRIRRDPRRCPCPAPPRPGSSSPSPAGRLRRATPPLATGMRSVRRHALTPPAARGGSDEPTHLLISLAADPTSSITTRRWADPPPSSTTGVVHRRRRHRFSQPSSPPSHVWMDMVRPPPDLATPSTTAT
ncbi:hypothetical protein VPH35_015041 [Triticum aestivum]